MIKVAFLIPKNKNCGVHDYSEKLFKKIMINNKSIKMKKVYYDYSNNPLYYFLLAKRLSKNYDLIKYIAKYVGYLIRVGELN